MADAAACENLLLVRLDGCLKTAQPRTETPVVANQMACVLPDFISGIHRQILRQQRLVAFGQTLQNKRHAD